jgi:protein O-mannosyl-transferase
MTLRLISAREFAGRFAGGVREHQQSFTWFLGAGCSRSSGIKDAGGLVEKWLTELYGLQAGPGENFDAWLKTGLPSYDPQNPALHYATAFESRHPFPADRQHEIEMICASGEPAYGYATLAQLLSHKEFGRFCSTILTTNFDDLIADALYLYGERHARPLVITHEALVRYVSTSSPRPIVVKLHDDAHLDPKNLQPETRELDQLVCESLYPFLQNHALVFAGYGGNDESILKFVQNCPMRGVAPPIYWVSKREPPKSFAEFLRDRGALRVDHTDFDQLMHLIRGALQIELLDKNRWDRIGDAYYRDFLRLKKEIEGSKTVSDDTKALKLATVEAEKSLPDEWSFYSSAREHEKSDPNQAEICYREGLRHYPKSHVLNGQYALFLTDIRKDMIGAEAHYKRALEADPNDVVTLSNYAIFLSYVRKDMIGAEDCYKRALEIDPNEVNFLVNYATFLTDIRKDTVTAETYYKRALEADPNNVNSLVNYATFVTDVRKDVGASEDLYKRALKIDPDDGDALGNYAQITFGLGRHKEAKALLDKAWANSANASDGLRVELLIYRFAHDPGRRREALTRLKDALTKGERTRNWSFAITLERAAKDRHPEVPLLTELVCVANDEADLANLDKYPTWRDA